MSRIGRRRTRELIENGERDGRMGDEQAEAVLNQYTRVIIDWSLPLHLLQVRYRRAARVLLEDEGNPWMLPRKGRSSMLRDHPQRDPLEGV